MTIPVPGAGQRWRRLHSCFRHAGDAVEVDDLTMEKVAGQAVDRAACVMGLGQGGQTPLTRYAFESARQYRFKGNEDDPLEILGGQRNR